MNKRLAIVNHNLGSGGAEKLIYDMALELKNQNIDFSVILLTSVNCIYGKKLIEEGIDVKYLSNKWDIYSLKNILRLKKILKNYDIIHSHTYAAQLWVAVASLFLNSNKKYLTTEHSTTNNRRKKLYFRYLDRWMYSKYNNIISITENVEKKLKEWINIKNNYEIIANGINLDKYINAKKFNREKLNFNEDDKIICQIARFSKVKCQETTVESLKYLPENYKVIFIGEGERRTVIEKLVREKKLESRVQFLGYRSDIPELLKMSDLAVLTSEYEGLPISAIEAMSLKPFIGSDVDGIKDLVHGYGELFEYKNSIDLSGKIQRIIEDKNEYFNIEKKCKERSQKFHIKNTVLEYIRVYKGE